MNARMVVVTGGASGIGHACCRSPGAMENLSALGRLVEPTDIANAVAFLLSDEAAAITGINLPVDAGWLVTPDWKTYPGIRGDWP